MMQNGRKALKLKNDYSIVIAEGGRLLGLEGQTLTGFKGVMKPRQGITTFSRRSRWELQKRMAVIDEAAAGLPDFLTFTYPGEWSMDWRVWKRDLKVFNQALVYKWPECWGVWRLEFQQRGAPHFHSLLWNGPGIEGLEVWDCQKCMMRIVPDPNSQKNREIFDWFSETWYRIVGSKDPRHLAAGTRIEPIQTWNGVVSYASKYLAKLPDGNYAPVEYTGRFWGVIQRDKWLSTLHRQNVPEAAFYMLRRVLRKKRERQKGKSVYLEPDSGITDIGLKDNTGFKLLAWAYMEMEARGNDNQRAPF